MKNHDYSVHDCPSCDCESEPQEPDDASGSEGLGTFLFVHNPLQTIPILQRMESVDACVCAVFPLPFSQRVLGGEMAIVYQHTEELDFETWT